MKKLLTITLLSFCLSAVAVEEDGFLKVCADPYMLPFSNQDLLGYENKIAALFAEELGLQVKYEFFPQRIGFIRNTLRAESEQGKGYKCDLVIGLPSGFEVAATTKPYYTSTYMLVFAKGSGVDEVTEPEMLVQTIKDKDLKFKIGVSDKGPGQLWVFYQELMEYMTPYQGQPGNPKVDPGHELIKDIVDGKIDAAVIWGPTAGYYAEKYKDKKELVLLPLKDDTKKNREMKFSYSISMAVRHGEKEWKNTIDGLIDKNRDKIRQILMEYGVPVVE